MLEIVKNPNVDWIGTKKWFITISTVLLLLGATSVYMWGFNLGIDFAGGTLVTVKFKEANPAESDIRQALAGQGLDPGKVILQPVRDPISGKTNQMLIRLPQREDVQPQSEQTDQTTAQGSEPDAEQTGDLTDASSDAVELSDQLDAEKRAILVAVQSFNDSDDVANKVDLNAIGQERLENELLQLDPLGLKEQPDPTVASSEYGRYAELIREYRDSESGGLIKSIGDLKNLPGIPAELVGAMSEHFYAGVATVVSAEIVGPQIGNELRQRAIYVVLASFVGMLLYIAFRFEWIYGVAAVIAVVHDLLITFGMFSILQWEISLTVVAAFLTLAGYSVNDTIVIFDRVRENLRLRRREDLTKLVNDSINQTLSRTILTSGLTLCAVVFLVIFGGPVLNGFAWALLIGVLVGTYSTLAIASPIMVWWQQFQAARVRRRVKAGRSLPQTKRKVAAN